MPKLGQKEKIMTPKQLKLYTELSVNIDDLGWEIHPHATLTSFTIKIQVPGMKRAKQVFKGSLEECTILVKGATLKLAQDGLARIKGD